MVIKEYTSCILGSGPGIIDIFIRTSRGFYLSHTVRHGDVARGRVGGCVRGASGFHNSFCHCRAKRR